MTFARQIKKKKQPQDCFMGGTGTPWGGLTLDHFHFHFLKCAFHQLQNLPGLSASNPNNSTGLSRAKDCANTNHDCHDNQDIHDDHA